MILTCHSKTISIPDAFPFRPHRKVVYGPVMARLIDILRRDLTDAWTFFRKAFDWLVPACPRCGNDPASRCDSCYEDWLKRW